MTSEGMSEACGSGEAEVRRVAELLGRASEGTPASAAALASFQALRDSGDGAVWLCLARLATRPPPPGLHPQARLLAAVQLKNELPKAWRPAARRLSPEAKEALKDLLLGLAAEEEELLAEMVAEALAGVARLEWPGGWPALFPALLAGLASQPGSLAQRRWLGATPKLLRALASRRVGPALRAFQELPDLLLPALLPVWKSFFQGLAQHSGTVPQTSLASAEACVDSVAILLDQGFREGSGGSVVAAVFESVQEDVAALLERRSKADGAERASLEQVLLRILESAVTQVRTNPETLVSSLPAVMSVGYRILLSQAELGGGAAGEALWLEGMRLLRQVASCHNYKTRGWEELDENDVVGRFFAGESEERPGLCRAAVLMELLREERLGLGERAGLGPASGPDGEAFGSELAMWTEAPEEYALLAPELEDAVHFSDVHPKAAAKLLLQVLAQSYNTHVLPLLASWTQAAVPQVSRLLASDADLLQYEALLLAISSIGQDDLDQSPQWVQQILDGLLGPELWAAEAAPSEGSLAPATILRRRSLLFGAKMVWRTGEGGALRRRLYEAVAGCLAREADVPLRLAAVGALLACLGHVCFVPDELKPWLPDLVTGLLRTMDQVADARSQEAPMEVLALVAENFGPTLLAHLGPLLAAAPTIFSGPNINLQSHVLSIFAGLVGSGSAEELGPIASLVTDLVRIGLQPHPAVGGGRREWPLLEQTLQLLLAFLQRAADDAISARAEGKEPLISAFPLLIQLISESTSDCLPQLLEAVQLFASFPGFHSEAGAEGVGRVLGVLGEQTRALESEGQTALLRTAEVLMRTGPAEAAGLETLLGAASALVCPSAGEGVELRVETAAALALARGVVSQGRALLSAEAEAQSVRLLRRMLTVRTELRGALWKAKLLTLAQLGWLGRSGELGFLTPLLPELVSGVWEDCEVLLSQDAPPADLVCADPSEGLFVEPDVDNSSQHRRWLGLRARDAVFALPLSQALAQSLYHLRSALGPQHYESLRQAVPTQLNRLEQVANSQA